MAKRDTGHTMREPNTRKQKRRVEETAQLASNSCGFAVVDCDHEQEGEGMRDVIYP